MHRNSAGRFGEAAEEMLAEGLPDLLHCHGEHQLQHPARATQPAWPQGFPLLVPPALNPFKTTLAIWGFNATER